MAAPTSAKAFIFQAPVGGVNFRQPLAAMDQQYSPWLLNVTCEDRYIAARPGTRIFATLVEVPTPSSLPLILGMASYNVGSNEKLFVYVQGADSAAGKNTVYEVTTGTPVLRFTCADGVADEAEWFQYKGIGSFLIEANTNSSFPTYDAASWTDAWVESSAGVGITIGPSAYYKGRVYALKSAGNTVYYALTVAQITGVLAGTFNVFDIFTLPGNMSFIATFSTADGVVNQQYLAFGNTSGEVLVYSGDFPDSTTWQIVGRFRIGFPIGARRAKILAYQNDALIITKSGLVSLRDLINKGNDAAIQQAITAPIESYWISLFSHITDIATSPADVGIVWSRKKAKIYVLCQGYINKSGSHLSGYATMLVYNIHTGAWSIWKLPTSDPGFPTTIGNLTVFQDEIYYCTGNLVVKFTDTVFNDELTPGAYTSYDFEIDGAWNSINSQATGKRIVGFEPVIDTDFSASVVNYGMIASGDFGVSTSAQATVPTHSGITSDYYSVGSDGNFLQYQVTGNSPSSGSPTKFNFYSCATYFTQGGIR